MTDAELHALNDTGDPQPGDEYRHYKGGRYRILSRAIREADLKPLVVYRDDSSGIVWVRSLEDFRSLVDRTDQPRFRKIYDVEITDLDVEAILEAASGPEPAVVSRLRENPYVARIRGKS
jgi:hypothetical protein